MAENARQEAHQEVLQLQWLLACAQLLWAWMEEVNPAHMSFSLLYFIVGAMVWSVLFNLDFLQRVCDLGNNLGSHGSMATNPASVMNLK